MRVLWSLAAQHALAGVKAYIANDDLAAAERVERRLLDRAAVLANTPYAGRPGRRLGRRHSDPGFMAFAAVSTAIAVGLRTKLRPRDQTAHRAQQSCEWAIMRVNPQSMRNRRDSLLLLTLGLSGPWALLAA